MSYDELRKIEEQLEQLEEEERAVSARRRKLHDRIAMFPDPTGRLEEQEEELSARRRELHEQIDDLRAQRDELRSGLPDVSE